MKTSRMSRFKLMGDCDIKGEQNINKETSFKPKQHSNINKNYYYNSSKLKITKYNQKRNIGTNVLTPQK